MDKYYDPYGQHIKNVQTGETGICVARPNLEYSQSVQIAPDTAAHTTVAWEAQDCRIIRKGF